MRAVDIIEKKKHGGELTPEELRWLICGYVNGEVEDYQMSAFTMAVYFCKMTEAETIAMTRIMAESGETLDLSCFGALSADKHSTGGVGDKTSLIVAPIVASLGAVVAKMSGRGLGHTGGTIDKLEAIPGYNTSLSDDAFITQAKKCGIALVGAGKELAPADKKLYALRDVTATVDSMPLIAASIMSKKLAAGAKNIVLDVKTGAGAFMTDYDNALRLARLMVLIGKISHRNISAVLTAMDAPLGHSVGNALEVEEALEVLSGAGDSDLVEVCVSLSAELLRLVFGEGDWKHKAELSLKNGSAMDSFTRWITAQGGDLTRLPRSSAYTEKVLSPCDGYISEINSRIIGETAMLLGAGRAKIADKIDMTAGVVMRRRRGDAVKCGECVAELHTSDEALIDSAKNHLLTSLSFSTNKPSPKPVIYEIIR